MEVQKVILLEVGCDLLEVGLGAPSVNVNANVNRYCYRAEGEGRRALCKTSVTNVIESSEELRLIEVNLMQDP